tara:strand:+ start:675 stop:899 length:225 start_codon:yes stop_codon:yes gene_type:complete
MKKIIFNPENPNGLEVELTAEEISQKETDIANSATERTEKENAAQAKEDLKASAKAKLVAGEALTQEEADTIVL